MGDRVIKVAAWAIALGLCVVILVKGRDIRESAPVPPDRVATARAERDGLSVAVRVLADDRGFRVEATVHNGRKDGVALLPVPCQTVTAVLRTHAPTVAGSAAVEAVRRLAFGTQPALVDSYGPLIPDGATGCATAPTVLAPGASQTTLWSHNETFFGAVQDFGSDRSDVTVSVDAGGAAPVSVTIPMSRVMNVRAALDSVQAEAELDALLADRDVQAWILGQPATTHFDATFVPGFAGGPALRVMSDNYTRPLRVDGAGMHFIPSAADRAER